MRRGARLLQSLGYQVAGVDAAPTMVGLAVSHEASAPAVLADAATLPFRDEAFGLVVAYMSLHDIREVRVPDDMVARQPAGRRWQRIPLMLHLRAVKP